MRATHLFTAGIGLFLAGHIQVHAQSTASSTDLQTMVEAVKQMPLTAATAVPQSGQFYSAKLVSQGIYVPLYPADILNVPAWNLGGNAWLLEDEATGNHSLMQTMDEGPLPPGGGSGTNGYYPPFTNTYTFDTNQLWIELSNIVNGTVYLNLHHGTDTVYVAWSATNLAMPFTDWTIETEVFPTDTNVTPFTVNTLNRGNLFLRAEDWSQVDSDGDGIPDWWIFYWFGNLSETATNLDSRGNTLGYDYTNGLDPNIINFNVRLGNQHFNTFLATGQFIVSAGVPADEAVLVNDTNFNDALWQPYDGNIHLTLGETDGVYQVWTALKGRAPDATPTWQGTTVYLDQTPPALTITNPAGDTVAVPYLQLQGWANERLANVTYDLSNAVAVVTNQTGYVTGEYLDTNSLTFTKSFFQCFDVWLTNGLNLITVHGTDEAGNTGSTNISVTLDYSGKTNPPVITLDWPADGMQIGQSNITVRGELSDPTAKISLQAVDSDGDTNEITGVVERDGHFWLQNVPLGAGTNRLILTAADVVSNVATMNLSVIENHEAGLSLNPVTDDLWKGTATVSGTIGDDSDAVTVNGVEATNNGDGTWTADNVPVSGGNVAVFNAQAATPGGTEAAQTATVKPAEFKLMAATWNDENVSVQEGAGSITNHELFDLTTTWSWAAGQGGGYHGITVQTPLDYAGSVFTEWDDAPILADGTIPYVHRTDSEGHDIYYSWVGDLGPWHNDFSQEVGALNVASPESSNWWENRSGLASWVLHTGGLSVAGKQNLFVLSAGATEEAQGMNEENSGTIVIGTNGVRGPEINNTGRQEDTNYDTYMLAPDGATVNAPIHTDRPLTIVGNGQTKYTLVHLTECTAIGNTNDTRTTIGIGEVVDFSGMPGNTTWSVSGNGAISSTNGGGTTFTASMSPGSATVTAQIGDVTIPTTFGIKAPDGIQVIGHTDNSAGWTSGTDEIGADTVYQFLILPTSVSFANVNFRENVPAHSIVWPDHSTNTFTSYYKPYSANGSCNFAATDDIGDGLYSKYKLFDGTSFVDKSFSLNWHDEYENQNGDWVDYVDKSSFTQFKGSSLTGQETYQGIPGGIMGPFQ